MGIKIKQMRSGVNLPCATAGCSERATYVTEYPSLSPRGASTFVHRCDDCAGPTGDGRFPRKTMFTAGKLGPAVK